MATPADSACAHCGKAAMTRCIGCVEGLDHPGEPSPTYYCDKQCQTKHWPDHKARCKLANLRKVIYRGGQLLQELFYAFREAAFDRNIFEITSVGGKLTVRERYDDTAMRILFRFPDHLVPNAELKKALLAHAACSDGLAWLYELTLKVFSGTERLVNLQEWNVVVDDKHHFIEKYDINQLYTKRCWHQVLLATLSDETKYVIDLAGAQYRQPHAVVSWTKYLEGYVVDCGKVFEHGAQKQRLEAQIAGKLKSEPHADLRIPVLDTKIAECMNSYVENWEKANGMTMSDLLRQKQTVFDNKKRTLVAEVGQDMQSFVQWWESKFGADGHDSKAFVFSNEASAAMIAGTRKATQATGRQQDTKTVEDRLARMKLAESDADPAEEDEEEEEEEEERAIANFHKMLARFKAGGGTVVQL